MAKKNQPAKGSRKTGTSKHSRAGNRGRQGTPRIMLAALVVVVVGAALLFWPKGGSTPTGIGEQHSVVTTPDSSSVDPTPTVVTQSPQSGDVDINQEGLKMTPETPEGAGDKTKNQEKTIEKPIVKPKPKPTPKPASKPAAQSKPTTPPIKPTSDGRWAVQAGGFGNAVNADREAERLAKAGWQAMVRTGNNSKGDMVYRVWIGYFSSREIANAFIRQNKKILSDAYAVHR